METKAPFNSPLGKFSCFTINLGELGVSVDTQFGIADKDKVIIPIQKVPYLIGMGWAKAQEAFLECEGKELVIDFGTSPSLNLLEAGLKYLLDLLKSLDETGPKKGTAL